MTTDSRMLLIRDEYERIKLEVTGGTLVGKLLDVDDVEQLVVGAFWLGQREGMSLPAWKQTAVDMR